MAQMTPQELHLMTRLASDPQIIQWLQGIAGEHLALCGTISANVFQVQQGKYQGVQDLLTRIQRGSDAYEQSAQNRARGINPQDPFRL